jgi:hypothetical protein
MPYAFFRIPKKRKRRRFESWIKYFDFQPLPFLLQLEIAQMRDSQFNEIHVG